MVITEVTPAVVILTGSQREPPVKRVLDKAQIHHTQVQKQMKGPLSMMASNALALEGEKTKESQLHHAQTQKQMKTTNPPSQLPLPSQGRREEEAVTTPPCPHPEANESHSTPSQLPLPSQGGREAGTAPPSPGPEANGRSSLHPSCHCPGLREKRRGRY
ncbi:formin-F-like [Sceloporus undulatus]|uniref:formin-F-like n=1 Tax=Sceloporus undulatus TaxID=8520 RepID=UPI001C4C0234|nr:formin-F-like [Sceloporus undulatus]